MKRTLFVTGLIFCVLCIVLFVAEMDLLANTSRIRGIGEPTYTCFNNFKEDESNNPILSLRKCRGCVVLPVLEASDSDTCELEN